MLHNMSIRKGRTYFSVLVETRWESQHFRVHDELYLTHFQARHTLDGTPVVLTQWRQLSYHCQLLLVLALCHELKRQWQSYPEGVESINAAHT